MSLGEFGLIDGLVFALGLLLEVPTGVIADLIGKKRAIQLAMLFLSVGSLIMGLSPDKTWLIWSMIIVQIGLAFYSGSVEAYVYDTLIDHQQTPHYDKVISTGMMLLNVAASMATLIGGWLYVSDIRAPLLAWSLFNWVGLLLSFWLSEPKTDSHTMSWQAYWQQTKEGMQALFTRSLRPLLPIMWLLLSAVYLWDWGMLRTVTATYFGLPVTSQATIFAILPLIGVIAVKFLPALRKLFSDTQGLVFFTLSLALAHGLIYFLTSWSGIIPLTIVALVTVFIYPWTSVIINRFVASKYRATALSTMALLTKIPYILLSPVIGWLADTNRYHWFGVGGGVLFVGVAILFALTAKVFNKKLDLVLTK